MSEKTSKAIDDIINNNQGEGTPDAIHEKDLRDVYWYEKMGQFSKEDTVDLLADQFVFVKIAWQVVKAARDADPNEDTKMHMLYNSIKGNTTLDKVRHLAGELAEWDVYERGTATIRDIWNATLSKEKRAGATKDLTKGYVSSSVEFKESIFRRPGQGSESSAGRTG